MTEATHQISLTVLSGPDTGVQKTFEVGCITIGRGGSNGYALSDGFVSNFHGEVYEHNGEVLYRDLKSRHGSLVCVDNVSFHLHNKQDSTSIKINHGTEIQIGCTLIKVMFDAAITPPAPMVGEQNSESFVVRSETQKMRETLITSSHKPMQSLTQQFHASDGRLDIIFRLASQLNGLTEFDDIFDLIVRATFEAFPAANFFAMTMLDDADELEIGDQVHTRRRDGHDAEETSEQPIFSRSILTRVIETRESVLFVRDSLGVELSQSIIDAKITACLCAPLVGQHSLLGVVEVDTRGQGSLFSKKDLDLFSIVASLAAFAFERVSLSENIVEMFESFVYASVNAIEARDPTTAGHSERVTDYTLELARACHELDLEVVRDIRFSEDEFTELRYAGLLHDFGKIGVSEATINKEMRLPQLHMDLVCQRFETIKALHYQTHVHQGMLNGLSRGEPMTSAQYELLASTHRAFCQALDEDQEFLIEAARAGFLPDDRQERVRNIGARHYTDANGTSHSYLTAFEIENLTIRRGTLNDDEWDEMRSHPAQSRDYLEQIPWSRHLSRVPYIAGAHHEKLDGSGYPDRLVASELLPQVRMMTIADIFDALTANDRPYRRAASVERTVSILREEASQNKLDADLVEIFVEHVIPKILHKIPSLQKTVKQTDG